MTKGINQLSAGEVWAGDFKTKYGLIEKAIVGSIARTDTSAKVLGNLPAGARITSVTLTGATESDAATTATVAVGYAGGDELSGGATQDVKGANGLHTYAAPVAALSSAEQVTGIYAETGTASTTGGPWVAVIRFVLP